MGYQSRKFKAQHHIIYQQPINWHRDQACFWCITAYNHLMHRNLSKSSQPAISRLGYNGDIHKQLQKICTGGPHLVRFFGILKKMYCAKFILHSNSTSTNFIPMAMKFVQVEIILVETVLVGDPLYLFFISKILHLNEASSQKNVYPQSAAAKKLSISSCCPRRIKRIVQKCLRFRKSGSQSQIASCYTKNRKIVSLSESQKIQKQFLFAFNSSKVS